LSAAIVAAIQKKVDDGTLSGVSPLNLGNGRIHLGGSVLHEVLTRFTYNVPASGAAITDGNTFEIRFDNQVAPATVVRFEFDDAGVVSRGHRAADGLSPSSLVRWDVRFCLPLCQRRARPHIRGAITSFPAPSLNECRHRRYCYANREIRP
jgi:hypothetical protein